jgi:predicted DNA-binding transcriptional regulator AlpA
MATPGRLLWPAEVAEWLGVPVATLYAQRYRGDPPGSLGVRCGRHLRWDPADLEEWLEAQKAGSGTAATGRSPSPSLPVRRGRSE